ncbi:hypothetical protein VKT23_000432 [Stygiomarasmius scandens]|uniref:Uncharacterized protein n=1 Tax=Marasmiellus scandens TaxID=2682957 RepID=A0ABR1K5A8_9AGAR
MVFMHTSSPVHSRSLSTKTSLHASTATHPEDEYTISAYGDISHSEIGFVPSISSGIEGKSTHERKEEGHRRNTKRQPPPSRRKKKKDLVTILYKQLDNLKLEDSDTRVDGEERDDTVKVDTSFRPRTRARTRAQVPNDDDFSSQSLECTVEGRDGHDKTSRRPYQTPRRSVRLSEKN